MLPELGELLDELPLLDEFPDDELPLELDMPLEPLVDECGVEPDVPLELPDDPLMPLALDEPPLALEPDMPLEPDDPLGAPDVLPALVAALGRDALLELPIEPAEPLEPPQLPVDEPTDAAVGEAIVCELDEP